MPNQVDVAVSAGGTGVVRLNGQDVSNAVAGLTINTHVGDVTTVLLRVPATKVRFDGEARVILQDDLVALLVAAGWTPPDE